MDCAEIYMPCNKIQIIGIYVGGKDLYGFVTSDKLFTFEYGGSYYTINQFTDIVLSAVDNDNALREALRLIYGCLLTQIPWTTSVYGIERAKIYTLYNNKNRNQVERFINTSFESKFRNIALIDVLNIFVENIKAIASDVNVNLFG